jgi:NAD(P)-dependent dehydrogenase (short-subunit alcohol dehydrogenase family)
MAPKAFVTGGTGALGAAVCRALLDAGYETHAATIERDPASPAEPGLEKLHVHVGDLTQEADAGRVFRDVGGPLAAVVATVGGFTSGALADVTAGEIDQLTALNLKSTILTLKYAYPSLKQRPGGAACVLVAARGAHTGGPGAALYSATKAGVANLALSASQEWMKDRISVNAILPSIFDTPRNRADMPDADFSLWPKPDEIAHVVRFLVSEQARIISGGAIPVYGRA